MYNTNLASIFVIVIVINACHGGQQGGGSQGAYNE
jgi:hypothetical protein